MQGFSAIQAWMDSEQVMPLGVKLKQLAHMR